MSEPKTIAQRVEEVLPGVYAWHIHDERIDARSDAYALSAPEGLVLVDPLPLSEPALAVLGKVAAICLTIQSHQRSAWRYRRRFHVPVYAPKDAVGLEEGPDHWYGPDATLPGGIRAIHAPGPCEASYVFRAQRDGTSMLLLGDLLVRYRRGFGFVDSEYMDAPAQARDSARRLLEVRADALLPGHGAPLEAGAEDALREALEQDEGP